jgi:branched-chain amino acid transport system substrate-binding protein
MAAALTVVAALGRANSTATEALIAALEGVSIAIPGGTLVVRREDHQGLQPIFEFRRDAGPSALPELVHEFTIPEIPLPLRNKQG